MADDGSAVQTYAIVPYAKWKAMEQRLQKAESDMNSPVQVPPEIDDPPLDAENSQTMPDPTPMEEGPLVKKDVKLKYRKVQMKKLISHIERWKRSDFFRKH